METIEAYKCKICGQIYNNKIDAYRCEFKHSQLAYANCLLKSGYGLDYINYCCGFRWNLTSEQKGITQDNCFIISHWQCCEKPAYKITSIEEGGYLRLCGCGSWDGYYGNSVKPDRLPQPHPKEELFIDSRYGR